jgi:uncharacterized protein
MIHPDTELKYINDQIGYGVFATKLIPKGTITWIMDKLDRAFEPSIFNKLEKIYHKDLEKYCFRDNLGRYVLCWDIARFVNHSFNPSCITTAYDFEVAVRDIHPGEELTDDYGTLNVVEDFECLPEKGTTRTIVKKDDILYNHQEWDAKLVDAFRHYKNVPQPLQQLIDKKYLEKVESVANGTSKMDSIINCYFDERRIAANGK